MVVDSGISREEAVKKLKRLGIIGEQVYLIDLILLIEIMWADGQAQKGEIAILENYLERHVENVNKRAGCTILNVQDAKRFIKPYIEERPCADTVSCLRELVKPVRFMVSNSQEDNKLKDELLFVCMDIASIATTDYPYAYNERFNEEEKKCFFDIQQALS